MKAENESTCSEFGIVANEADSASIHSSESHDDVLGKIGHDLEEFRIVDQQLNHFFHVVSRGRLQRDHRIQRWQIAVPQMEESSHFEGKSIIASHL